MAWELQNSASGGDFAVVTGMEQEMNLRWVSFMAGILLTAGIASAVRGTWLSTSAIPSSVEIVTAHTSSSTGPETTPVMVVYMGSTVFAAPYNSEKAKTWFEMFKAAIQSSKKVDIYYDWEDWVVFYLCEDFGSAGACGSRSEAEGHRIQRVSFQP